MADRYEPKLSVRPTSERKGSDGRQPAADDPLAELARIVSGRGPAGGAPRQRSPEPPKPAAPPPDVVGDLEAELLSDLEASFAAVKQQISAQNPPAAPEPAPPAPRQQPSPPPVAATPRPRPAETPPPAPKGPPTMAPPPATIPVPPPQAAEPAPPQPAAPPPVPAQPRVTVAARPPLQGGAAPLPAPPRAQPAPTAGGRKVDIANLQLRPSTVAPPRPNPPQAGPAEPPQPKPSRWDKPAEPPKAEVSPASRFAPPKASGAPAPAPQQPPPEEEEFPFSETFPFSGQGETATAEEELPLDGFDALPGFGEEDQLAPYPDEDEFDDDMPRRGVPRSLVAIAGLLAVVLIAGIGFLMLRPGGGSDAAPPIIAADTSPTKVAPPEPPASDAADQQNKLIYDRVDSGPGAGTGDTTLVTPGSQPIAPTTDSGSDNPISRVILPGGPAPEVPGTENGDATAGGNSDLAMNEDGDSAALGPKKVRTVIVRPDGTIVSSDAVPADGAPASADAPDATADVPAVPEIPPAATDDDTAAIAGGRSGEELAITPLGGTGNAEPAPPVTAPTPPARTQTPTPAPSAPARTTVANNDQGPIDLTRGSGSAGANSGSPTVATTASGMMVQVSSQRSEEAANATYRDLQRRYASILGGYEPNIQRADLGDRGVYYRVRVGPFSPDDAQTLCSSLKGAGGDCILAKR